MLYLFGLRARALTVLVLLGFLQLTGGCVAGALLSSSPLLASPLGSNPIGSPSLAAAGGPGGAQSASLLVVITYGNGWSAASSGNGLRTVAEMIRRQFPNEQVITRGCNDHDHIRQLIENHHGPVALVGHSFGGCRSVEIAASLRRSIDWMILLDPVPCDDWAFPHPGKYFQLPATVLHATCFYRGAGMFPISYPIAHPTASMENRLRPLGHGEFCENTEVRNCILEVCARAEAGRFSDTAVAQALHNH